MKKTIISFFLILIFLSAYAKEEATFLSYQGQIEVQAINNEKLQEEIIVFLQNQGGYFTYRDSMSLKVKINPQNILPFIDFLKEKGMIISQNLSNYNYQQEYQRLQVTIKTQEETLETILKLFDKAGLYETLDIERKIRAMILEIERAKGRVRFIEERVKYAYLTLLFKSYQAQITPAHQCPFLWIEQLDFYKLF